MANNRSSQFLSGSPYLRRMPSYLNQYEMNTATLNQCWHDWHRDGKNTSGFIVNGLSTEIHAERFNKFATPEDLKEFWQENFIANVLNYDVITDKEKRSLRNQQNQIMQKALEDYLPKYFHQGGIHFLLQATLFKYLQHRGVGYSMSSTVRQCKMKAVQGKIIFHEKFMVPQLRLTESPEEFLYPENSMAGTKQTYPLITAELKHHISIDGKGHIQHFFDDLIVQFDSEKTQQLLDQDYEQPGLIKFLRETLLGKRVPNASGYTLNITPPRKNSS